VLGTDAQLVQIELKKGETLQSEPGSMCYMSSNVRSITSVPGGVSGGVARILSGEPFFLNTFKNISRDEGEKDGYIALAGKREGDKIIVLDLDQCGGEFLCARDSYLCNKARRVTENKHSTNVEFESPPTPPRDCMNIYPEGESCGHVRSRFKCLL